MNGRLRLDKLQELIEQYLKETRPAKRMDHGQDGSKDRNNLTLFGENVALAGAVSHPEKSTAVSNAALKVDEVGTLMPIYVKVPKPSTFSRKTSVAADLENAVPFSDLISNGRHDPAQGLSFKVEQDSLVHGTDMRNNEDRQHMQDSDDSTIDQASIIDRVSKLMMHRSMSLPISLLSSIRSQNTAYDDKVKSDYGRTSPHNSSSFASRSTEERQHESCLSHTIGQATGECEIESQECGTRRRSLVNREAIEFSIGPRHSTETPKLNEDHGLLATALEQQSMRNFQLIQANDLMVLERLSTGRISSIYRGVWMSRSQHNAPYQVALKVATITDASSLSFLEELRREADIASQLQHFNLCELKGICQSPE